MVTAEVLEEEKKKREENAQVRDKIIQRQMCYQIHQSDLNFLAFWAVRAVGKNSFDFEKSSLILMVFFKIFMGKTSRL